MRPGPAMGSAAALTSRAFPARCAPMTIVCHLVGSRCDCGWSSALIEGHSVMRHPSLLIEPVIRTPRVVCHVLAYQMRNTVLCCTQGLVDASGFCCYGTVDSFGVCNGWDASGQIGITLLAGSASLAYTSAVAGYLGTSISAVHAVSLSNGWATLDFVSKASCSNGPGEPILFLCQTF